MNQPGKNASFDTNMFVFFLQKETRQEYGVHTV